MLPPVSIIVGACSDKMLDFWMHQGKDDGYLLVPIVAKDRVYLNLRVETPVKAKFKPTTVLRSNPAHTLLTEEFLNPVWTTYQSTVQIYPTQFFILKIYEMPIGFKLTGGYEELPRVGNSEDSVKLFSAEFEPKDNEWQVNNVRNSGID